ncbi:MAG: pyridoxal-phosphate dependent enzyme [Bacteroidia bacterium]|nr:pyridoxal-phosphate dependent enzyme [Bacteroidia bacterium]NNM24294.1 pyridoxal-phosphate dependent enzyme [Flavobacteriaceae bacterium]
MEEINPSDFDLGSRSLSLLREDQVHSVVSGNKFRKLKYNLEQAKAIGSKTLVTFGGAYSNHLAATAFAGASAGFNTIGIVRGEELAPRIAANPTLSYAQEQGMELRFIPRSLYKMKSEVGILDNLLKDRANLYLLPEGGTNELAVKGCTEILDDRTSQFDYICVSVGTGGTLAGILRSASPKQITIGYSALKGTFQKELIHRYCGEVPYTLVDDHCFGGYGKIDSNLIRFINNFKRSTGIPLDPVYTGKMMYGIMDGIKSGLFKENSRILAVHTGGLQGISGMNQRLKKKQLPQII